ncbi:sensor histidine kinase [Jeotgalibacillus proteolyticus]|uniref:histidine kinase n=1 Tax=Jeotgalibacillus proteolyticus TaxID=2082395 RepID=A0A2S5GH67_9BACL|nr:HAMP domain-containing sensor histidine kinase [Jeotgalibacillus proteolyticus]PPA72264.1 two-component sensor histidine kinase [Jeotgalibacillus proteolyticus]
MKLQNKIHLYTSAVFAALLAVISISIYLLFSNLTYSSALESAQLTAKGSIPGVNQTVGLITDTELLRIFVPPNGAMKIITDAGESIGSANSMGQNHLSETPDRFYQEERVEIIRIEGERYTFVSMPNPWVDGTVINIQYIESLEAEKNNLQVLRNVLIIVTLIGMIPVILSARVLSNLVIKPITSMISTMKEIQDSGEFKRLPLENKSKDELYEMGNTFNLMMDLLETNFDKQDQFISNASHELKTPLTVIESYANLLKRRGFEQKELANESIEAIHSEAIRMKELTQQLLLLARQGENWNLQLEEVMIEKMTKDSIKAFQNASEHEIEFLVKEKVKTIADKQKLRQLLYIFLDNAHKYSDEKITVVVGRNGEEGYIRIEDRGQGIPKEDLPKVFDRFYRVDKARNRKSGGSGLGLSLAKELAAAIQARITLDSLEGVGTIATIYLPLKKDEAAG